MLLATERRPVLLTTERGTVRPAALWAAVLLLTGAWVVPGLSVASRLSGADASTSHLCRTRWIREATARDRDARGSGEAIAPALAESLTGFGLVAFGRPVVVTRMCLSGTFESVAARTMVGWLALLLRRDRPGPLGGVRSVRCARARGNAEGAGAYGQAGGVCNTGGRGISGVNGTGNASGCCKIARCRWLVAIWCWRATGQEGDASRLNTSAWVATAVDLRLGMLGLAVVRRPGSTVLRTSRATEVKSVEGKGGGGRGEERNAHEGSSRGHCAEDKLCVFQIRSMEVVMKEPVPDSVCWSEG